MAVFWNLVAIDYVAWSFRDLWSGMVMRGFPFSLVVLVGVTILSIVSTRYCWVYFAERPASVLAFAGLILSFAPVFCAYAVGHLLSIQISFLG